MDFARRQELLTNCKPETLWPGEPLLGGWYTEEEIDAAVASIRSSMDWRVGFGFIVEEILELERAFAEYCGVKECVTINGACTGLDMAMMCLNLEPGDEVIAPSINFRAAPMAIIGQGGGAGCRARLIRALSSLIRRMSLKNSRRIPERFCLPT